MARFGGDEFAVLLQRLEGVEDAERVAQRILRELRRPVEADGQEIVTSASVGIALVSGEHTAPEQVLRDADTAMYRAKSLGRNRYAIFDVDLRRTSKERELLRTEIEAALGRGEFAIVYQPRADLRNGQVRGFEALLRWAHPRHGLLRPATFLEVAEDAGRLVEIERWVVGAACRELAGWRLLNGNPEEPLTVSVNLCSRQLQEPDLADYLESTLGASGLEPEHLQLEIHEESLLDPTSNSLRRVESLTRLGVSLFIDDFGTGYSSLNLLRSFPSAASKSTTHASPSCPRTHRRRS